MLLTEKIMITILISFCSLPYTQAQPYLDLCTARQLTSPDAGIIHRQKNNHSLTYRHAGANLPLAFTPINGIIVVNPFYEQWETALKDGGNTKMKHGNFVLAISLVDTSTHRRWRYAITPIIRMKNPTEDGFSSAQLGVAGLAIFTKSKAVTLKFGAYFNTDYFGNFFMPLLGIDWWINERNKLFGILPGNLVMEHRLHKHLYCGAAFRAITNSYRDEGGKYFRVNDNQFGLFADIYATKNIVFNAEIGHSVFRKLVIGIKNVFTHDLSVNDNLYIKAGVTYRIRFQD